MLKSKMRKRKRSLYYDDGCPFCSSSIGVSIIDIVEGNITVHRCGSIFDDKGNLLYRGGDCLRLAWKHMSSLMPIYIENFPKACPICGDDRKGVFGLYCAVYACGSVFNEILQCIRRGKICIKDN